MRLLLTAGTGISTPPMVTGMKRTLGRSFSIYLKLERSKGRISLSPRRLVAVFNNSFTIVLYEISGRALSLLALSQYCWLKLEVILYFTVSVMPQNVILVVFYCFCAHVASPSVYQNCQKCQTRCGEEYQRP